MTIKAILKDKKGNIIEETDRPLYLSDTISQKFGKNVSEIYLDWFMKEYHTKVFKENKSGCSVEINICD